LIHPATRNDLVVLVPDDRSMDASDSKGFRSRTCSEGTSMCGEARVCFRGFQLPQIPVQMIGCVQRVRIEASYSSVDRRSEVMPPSSENPRAMEGPSGKRPVDSGHWGKGRGSDRTRLSPRRAELRRSALWRRLASGVAPPCPPPVMPSSRAEE
jgi:hypothetical protein